MGVFLSLLWALLSLLLVSIPVQAAEAVSKNATFKSATADQGLFSTAYILVLLLLALAAAWLWLCRRQQGPLPLGDEPASLRLVQRQRLSPKATLHVVRYGEHEWLLAEDGHGVSVLAKVDAVSASVKTAVGGDQ